MLRPEITVPVVSGSIRIRAKFFTSHLKAYKKERNWSMATYSTVTGWFKRNAGNTELIKANNRDVHIDKYYKEFSALFIPDVGL